MKVPFFVKASTLSNIPLSIRFVVLTGISAVGFQSVSEIGKTGDFSYIVEGGNNQYPYLMRKPQETPHRLTFKRGITLRGFSLAGAVASVASGGSPLGDMSLDPLKSMLKKGTIGTILVLDHGRNVKAIYSFVSQGIIEWSLSELNAQRSEPLIETITIAHNGLMSLPIPDFL